VSRQGERLLALIPEGIVTNFPANGNGIVPATAPDNEETSNG
jgi:hypothetical protein